MVSSKWQNNYFSLHNDLSCNFTATSWQFWNHFSDVTVGLSWEQWEHLSVKTPKTGFSYPANIPEQKFFDKTSHILKYFPFYWTDWSENRCPAVEPTKRERNDIAELKQSFQPDRRISFMITTKVWLFLSSVGLKKRNFGNGMKARTRLIGEGERPMAGRKNKWSRKFSVLARIFYTGVHSSHREAKRGSWRIKAGHNFSIQLTQRLTHRSQLE